jgi:Zn-dependent protease
MDLKLGSIPVQITGRFLFMALILGINELNPAKLGIWLVVVLVSVLIHELGHALIGKAFGLVPRIVLHGMGGHTFFEADPSKPSRGEIGTGKSIAISLAGPFAGFLFALVVIIAQLAGVHPTHPLARHALGLLFAVNIGWGIFNLLPMLPLDGGNVLRSILTAITKDKGDKIARIISVAIAAGIGLYALKTSQWWVLYLGVLFGFQNVQSLRQVGQSRVDQALATAIEKAYQALDRKEPKEAIALLEPALVPSASADLRQVGLRVYVVSLMKEGLWPEALNVIERERQLINADDLSRYAETMREIGREEDATRIEALKAPPALSEFRA